MSGLNGSPSAVRRKTRPIMSPLRQRSRDARVMRRRRDVGSVELFVFQSWFDLQAGRYWTALAGAVHCGLCYQKTSSWR